MNTIQAAKLKSYLEKTAGFNLGNVSSNAGKFLQTATPQHFGNIPSLATQVGTAVTPEDSQFHNDGSIADTLGWGTTANTVGVASEQFPSILSKAFNPSQLIPALGQAGLNTVTKGIGGGLAGIGLSLGLNEGENQIEKAVGYTPNDGTGSQLYSGVDPSPLYINTGNNYLDTADRIMTGSGGLKNTFNNGLASAVGGVPGMIAGLGFDAVRNLYSDAKGLYDWHNVASESARQQKQFQIDNARIADRQVAQAKAGVPFHNPNMDSPNSPPIEVAQGAPNPMVKPPVPIPPGINKQSDFDPSKIKSKFKYLSNEDLHDAMMTQPQIKKILSLCSEKEQRELIAELREDFKKNPRTIGGTVFESPVGTAVGINKQLYQDKKNGKIPKDAIRTIIAHEAFHQNNPILGNSEILAHAYGGLRSRHPYNFFNYTSIPIQLLEGLVTRPIRFGIEAGLPLALGYGAYKAFSKPKKELNKQSDFDDIRLNVYQILHKLFGIKPVIDTDKNISRKHVESSNIDSVGYSPSSKTLEVMFKNHSRYRYPFIKPEVYSSFMNSESKGKYFHKHIKPIGLYEKLSQLMPN